MFCITVNGNVTNWDEYIYANIISYYYLLILGWNVTYSGEASWDSSIYSLHEKQLMLNHDWMHSYASL